MTPYKTAQRWHLARGLFQATLDELAIDGQLNREGVAFFLGRHQGDEAHLTHICLLRGSKLNKTVDHLRIDPALMNEVTDLAITEEIMLLGQVHSHGPGYGTDLSFPDHFYGIRIPGFLSLVVPDFALQPGIRLTECGVHVFDVPKGFRRMNSREVQQRFNQLMDIPHQVIVASV